MEEEATRHRVRCISVKISLGTISILLGAAGFFIFGCVFGNWNAGILSLYELFIIFCHPIHFVRGLLYRILIITLISNTAAFGSIGTLVAAASLHLHLSYKFSVLGQFWTKARIRRSQYFVLLLLIGCAIGKYVIR